MKLRAWFWQPRSAAAIAAWLRERSLAEWSAALSQLRTEAHRKIVHEGMAGDDWLRDLVVGEGEDTPAVPSATRTAARDRGASIGSCDHYH